MPPSIDASCDGLRWALLLHSERETASLRQPRIARFAGLCKNVAGFAAHPFSMRASPQPIASPPRENIEEETIMSTMIAKIVHISIDRHWTEVYGFASRPENMPLWASGLASGLKQNGEDWIAEGILGTARVRFAARNDFGVLDHRVTLDSGLQVHNALRIVPNGDGCEVMFTLLQLPGMTEEQFAADAAHVLKDLGTLKELMER